MGRQMDEALLRDQIEIAADAGWQIALRQVPARWAVALLEGEDQTPIQLLCLRNLRRGLSHRIQEQGARKVDWKQIVRRVRWQRVGSAFEADWIYLSAVRRFFPQSWSDLVNWGEAQFVHVDVAAQHPHYVRTSDVSRRCGIRIGPFPQRAAANQFIELICDAFDLCRYPHILEQSPHGKACAYKEMGKCPAPCDGSISMESYRAVVDSSVNALIDPAARVAEQRSRMEQAAAEMRYETAAAIKGDMEKWKQLGKGAFAFARPIEKLAFVTVQPAVPPALRSIYLVRPGSVRRVACLLAEPANVDDLMEVIGVLMQEKEEPADPAILSLLARHLFAGKRAEGVWIAAGERNSALLQEAVKITPPSVAVSEEVERQ